MLLKAIATWISAVFSYISYTVLGDLLGYILSRPKIIFLKNGWIEPNKGVSVPRDYGKYPTSDTVQEDYDKEVHCYYGITIHNKHFLFGRPKAEITSTTIEIWDSNGGSYTGKYEGRYWDSSSSGSHPLYRRGSSLPRYKYGNFDDEKQVIGDGENLQLVIAYNFREDGSGFYRFTQDSDTYPHTSIEKDRFTNPMPHYARVMIHADKQQAIGYFLIDSERYSNTLQIRAIKKTEIPFSL